MVNVLEKMEDSHSKVVWLIEVDGEATDWTTVLHALDRKPTRETELSWPMQEPETVIVANPSSSRAWIALCRTSNKSETECRVAEERADPNITREIVYEVSTSDKLIANISCTSQYVALIVVLAFLYGAQVVLNTPRECGLKKLFSALPLGSSSG